MIYRDFQDLHLSLLGFGTMRLPTTADGAIDEDTTQAMVDYALAHGVNYFDTAWAYMQNLSETVVGRCLKKHPRDSFYLATKYPGHTLTCDPDPADTFAQQLEKCQVDYFDFYLLHNVYENDVDIYTDPQWGIIDYFVEQKRLGRIKHLGFSTHADLPCLTAFLERYGKEMEFCQIQLNYLDWTIQRAREKYELLEKHHIPVWVMEPVRGGKLAALDADSEQQLHALRPNASIASFGFRWLQGLDNVHMVLSGMSDMAQMADNVATFERLDPLSPAEEAILFAAADKMKNSIPCTACRYCCDGCPQQLDIPDLLHKYNQPHRQRQHHQDAAGRGAREQVAPRLSGLRRLRRCLSPEDCYSRRTGSLCRRAGQAARLGGGLPPAGGGRGAGARLPRAVSA